MEREEWRDIVGYEGIYQVSNTGKVRSLFRYVMCKDGRCVPCKEHIMVTQTDKKGYERVQLFKGGEKAGKLVHRLVAIAFLPNPNGHPSINHKDFNPRNNCCDNLEWCTTQYNNKYSLDSGRYKRTDKWRNNHKKAVEKFAKAVIATKLSDGSQFLFLSEDEAAKCGHTLSSISRCCNGKQKKHHGYKWRYATNDEKEAYRKE